MDQRKVACAARAGAQIFHFHDLRATRLGDRGASAFEIAQIMGWSDIRIAMRYTYAIGDGISEYARKQRLGGNIDKQGGP